MNKPVDPLALASAAVDYRTQAAKALYRAAVVERDAQAQADQRATLHALIDEELDIAGGIITNLMRGQQ